MKRKVLASLAFFGLCFSAVATAQGSSTRTREPVTIAANWDVKQRRNYSIVVTKSNPKDRSESSYEYLTSVEVLARTASGYRLSVDVASPHSVNGRSLSSSDREHLAVAFGALDLQFLLRTDESGSPIHLENWEKVKEQYSVGLRKAMKPAPGSKEEKIVDQLTMQMYASEESTRAVALREVGVLFAHLSETHAVGDPVEGVQRSRMGPLGELEMKVRFGLELDTPRKGISKRTFTQEADSNSFVYALKKWIATLAPDQALKLEKEALQMNFVDHDVIEFESKSGWALKSVAERGIKDSSTDKPTLLRRIVATAK